MKITLFVSLFLGVACLAPVANAALTLRVEHNGGTIELEDGAAGDMASQEGALQFMGVLGNFDLVVTTGISKPLIGDDHNARLSMTTIRVTSEQGAEDQASLTFWLSDSDYSLKTNTSTMTLESEVSGTPDGLVEATSYYDSNNTLFGTGDVALEHEAFGANSDVPLEESAVGMRLVASGTPLPAGTGERSGKFSLTQRARLTHVGSQISEFSIITTAHAPEPSTALMLAGLALCCGLITRYRRTQPAAIAC